MAMKNEELMKLDLYKILGIKENAKPNDIKVAYKKKAIELHPDKNKDNPEAHDNFVQLKKVYDFLLDTTNRSTYDKKLRAAEEARQRHRELDERRRRFKEKLQREEDKKFSNENEVKQNLEKLRKEGEMLVKEQEALWKKKLRAAKMEIAAYDFIPSPIVRVLLPAHGHYTVGKLTEIFSKYGTPRVALNGLKALVEFDNLLQANMAVKCERGMPEAPFQVSHLKNTGPGQPSATETLTQRAVRQQAERDRLIAQMRSDDAYH